MDFYSQDGQDKFIFENFFKDKKNGIFIDIGANDGITLSNSYFFEKIGWDGYCIEPIPKVFERLKTNRKCKCINGVISDNNGYIDFLEINGYSEMLSGIYDQYDLKHIERINKEISLYGGSKTINKVKSYIFNDLIEEKYIDYLSIDTEGSEFQIIKTIDFIKYKIQVISIENNYFSTEMVDFILSKGYEHITNIGADNIFKLK